MQHSNYYDYLTTAYSKNLMGTILHGEFAKLDQQNRLPDLYKIDTIFTWLNIAATI